MRADLERTVGGIADVLRPVSAASGCAAEKLKAAAHLGLGVPNASAKLAPHPADQLAALQPIATELTQGMAETFARLESGGGCLTTGDAAARGAGCRRRRVGPLSPTGVADHPARVRAVWRRCPWKRRGLRRDRLRQLSRDV